MLKGQALSCLVFTALSRAGKIWTEFQHVLISGRSLLRYKDKDTNQKINDWTWSRAGPGAGPSFKVLHSVPLVTNLPFPRFSET